MSSLSKIILPAVALILFNAVPAIAGSAGGFSQRIIASPDAGVSYPVAPTIVTPAAAQPGQEVPFSTQTPSGSGTPPLVQPTSNQPAASSPAGGAQATSTGAAGAKPAAPIPPPIAYDGSGHPYSGQYFKKHSHSMTIALLRRPELKPGQFMLHLAVQYIVSGCPKMSKIPTTVNFKESAFEILLDDYTVDMRKLTPAPQYACHLRPYTPFADVILDKDDLVAKDIHQIKLKVGRYSDTYDIDLNAQRIRLAPSTMQRTPPMFQTVKVGGLSTPLTHWFYPAGTVILYVPGAKDRDLSDAVAALAKEKGLEPMQDEFPDFKAPTARPQYYYIDRNGTLGKNHEIAEGAVVAGTVPAAKKLYGLEKDEQTTETLEVLARLPNSYE
jgi:hypothetical protein